MLESTLTQEPVAVAATHWAKSRYMRPLPEMGEAFFVDDPKQAENVRWVLSDAIRSESV